MAKYSAKMMGKEVGDAGIYAEPHTMSGKKTDVKTYMNYTPGAEYIKQLNVSVGGISKGNYGLENPHGVGVMRGGGAATKGLKTSGKMG